MNTYRNKTNLLRNVLLAGLFFVTLQAGAQENLSMYYLHSVPHSTRLNPSTTFEYNGYFGGLIIPVSGQVLPPLNIGISINSFSYSDVIYKPGGIYGDSLGFVLNDSIRGRQFADGLKPVNRIDFHTYIDLLHFGFRTKNIFWHFSMVEKIEAGISFPRDILRLPLYGNANFPDPTIDLSGFGARALHYREIGFGATYEYSSALSFGAKAKVLFGMANVSMDKTDIKWYTDPATGDFRFNTNFDINFSQPMVELTELRYDTEGDSLAISHEEKDFDPISYALNMKNRGLAVDLGVTYSPISNVKVHASITDLGYIRWKDQVTNIRAKGQFDFAGINLSDLLDDSVSIEDVFRDSLFRLMDVQLSHNEYKTAVPLNIFLGGSYQLTDAISFGAVYRGRKWFEEFASSFTVSANINRRGFGTVVSYTAMKGNMNNLGFGLALKLGGWQTFLMTDNLLDAVYPHKAREVSIRFGTNWILGREKKHAALMQ